MAFQKKGKSPVTAKQAGLVANMMKAKGKAPAKMPMDAEDMIDGGVDEATEKN